MFKMGYYTTKEAANIVGVSYATILKWIHTGVFTGIVYQEDYVGHPAQMIPVEQVNLARKLRLEDGILRFKPGILEPIIEEPKVPTREEMIKDKIRAGRFRGCWRTSRTEWSICILLWNNCGSCANKHGSLFFRIKQVL